MGQHEQAPAGFVFFMRLFIIFLATRIYRGIRGLEETEGEHGPEETEHLRNLLHR